MQVWLNDQPIPCLAGIALSQLLAQLSQPVSGVALAVNDRIVPQNQWANYLLQDNDRILLFQTIAGG
ncbi:sulfur carrier protein ThiS [Salmonella enterica subsp. enterica serovar Choleraesuis]|nr:sulfur carrier protein ThiS [Salmonella enterica subsp. enterica serovar Choleraesuis]